MHLSSYFQWNPETVHIGEVRSDAFQTKNIAFQYKYLGDTEKEGYQYQNPKADESILHSINSVLFNSGSKMKQ